MQFASKLPAGWVWGHFWKRPCDPLPLFPLTRVISIQITVPNALHFLESSCIAWFLFLERGDQMHSKKKPKQLKAKLFHHFISFPFTVILELD